MKIEEILEITQDQEDEKTKEIFKTLRKLDEISFFDEKQVIRILKWKSPRPLRHYLRNPSDSFARITELAFAQSDERLKIHILTALKGVKYPSASAILMFRNPERYPVLDIRVWRQLYQCKLLDQNPSGIGFSLDDWELYLKIIRKLSKVHNLTVRQVEKRIFDYDKKYQIGKLYQSNYQ